MILEDDQLIAAMMSDWLRELGCDTIGPARDVSSAIELLERAAVDAAILDISLQAEKCYSVAAALRRRGIPLAFATGHTVGAISKDYRDAPTLLKPCEFADCVSLGTDC